MSTDSVLVEIEPQLQAARQAAYTMATLETTTKNEILLAFAELIESQSAMLLEANRNDLREQQGQLAPSLYQRLKLDEGKLKQLAQGVRDVANLPDPSGRVLSRTLLDDGLMLEKVSVPLGVIAIIFESRPDVIPQILSLILKSGNAVVLKGGREATHSNAAFMTLVAQLNQRFANTLPPAWAQLLDSREAIRAVLDYPQYVDLVIPRGSNQLVQDIMANTRIPVLGHADGICHLYVHASANVDKAIPVVIDAKAQYPAACNAVETLLVDSAIANAFLPRFKPAAQNAGITLKGCYRTQTIIPGIATATDDDWSTEYGEPILSVRIVDSLDQAIEHIHRYGSHHTDGILATDPHTIETFLNRVDSASVFSNASTRFADGFRFGLGAESGISTARTHARGPVGLEGLVIYKYKLRGNHHQVADYVGADARPFRHQRMPHPGV